MKMYMKKKKDFTIVDNKIIRDRSISDGEFRTLVELMSYSFEGSKPFASQETMANEIGKSRETVNAHLRALKELGVIDFKRRGYSTTNLYTIKCEDYLTNGLDISDDFSISDERVSSHDLWEETNTNNTKSNKTEDKKTDVEHTKETETGMEKILKENPFLQRGGTYKNRSGMIKSVGEIINNK